MRSTSLARVLDTADIDSIPEVRAYVATAAATAPQISAAARVPALRVQPLLSDPKTVLLPSKLLYATNVLAKLCPPWRRIPSFAPPASVKLPPDAAE